MNRHPPKDTAALLCALAWGTSCADGQRLDLGEDQPLQVRDATYFREPLVASVSEPEVQSASFTSRVVAPGTPDKTFKGTLGVDATAVAIALGPENGTNSGGYWVLPASPPFVETPEFPSFHTALSFSNELLAGTYELSLSAVTGAGAMGPIRKVQFLLAERKPVTGELVFSLDWSHDVDLDVHVITPDGNEIFNNDVTDVSATAGMTTGGALDFDSNGDCRIDGRRNENVVWASDAPSGSYTVRVDAFSLCGEQRAYWRVTTTYKGKLVAATTGIVLPTDTRGQHGRGAGLTAMTVNLD